MTLHTRLINLIKNKGDSPCVSLIIPLPSHSIDRVDVEKQLRDMTHQAIEKLKATGNPESKAVIQRLEQVINKLDIATYHADGLAILTSAHSHEMVPLTGPCQTMMEVGPFFHLTSVAKGTQYPARFFFFFFSKYKSLLCIRDHNNLSEIITPLQDASGNPLQGFPLDNIPPSDKYVHAAGSGDRGADYIDAEAKRFLQLIDKELYKVITEKEDLPVIICGTPKSIELFRTISHHANKITLEIPHSYTIDQGIPHNLKDDLDQAIEKYNAIQRKKIIEEFQDAANFRRQACGITYVWEMVSTGRAQKLIIEPTIKEFGRIDPENPAHLQIFTQQTDPLTQPIADILIHEALLHATDVYVVNEGDLKNCQGVGAIARY